MVRPRDRKDLLLEAGMALASELSLPVVLQRIVDLAREVTDARYGALGVLDETGHVTEFVTSGISDQERQAIGPLPKGRGILGVIIHKARPLRLGRISDDPRSVGFPPNHPPMKSFLGAPVMAGGRVFGNIYLTEKCSGPEFSPMDEEALVVLAGQAGVAVANAVLYQEARRRQRWLEALREVVVAVLVGTEWEDLLELVVQRSRELADAAVASVVVPTGHEPTRLWVVAAAGSGAERLRSMQLPYEGSISGDVLRTGEPVVLDNVSQDVRAFQPMVRRGDLGPTIFVALRTRGRVLGTLAVANHSGGRRLGAEVQHLLETFADQAALALEYVRTQRELRRLTVLEERERIAKELHDGIIQSLFAIGMELEAAASMTEPEQAARLGRAVEGIDRSIRDLRNYIFGLRPGILADRQLGQAIQDLAEDVRGRTGLDVRCRVDPSLAAALAGSAADVVQIVREALSNTARHAQARRCLITLRPGARGAVLTLRDDGQGFDPRADSGGHGLRNMRERARYLGGAMRITTAPGRGTALTFTIPR